MKVQIPKIFGDIFEALLGALWLDCEGKMSDMWMVMGNVMEWKWREDVGGFVVKAKKK